MQSCFLKLRMTVTTVIFSFMASFLCSLSFLSLQQICPRTTMQCFASEIIVLTHEWELEPKWKKLNRLLSRLASRINQV